MIIKKILLFHNLKGNYSFKIMHKKINKDYNKKEIQMN